MSPDLLLNLKSYCKVDFSDDDLLLSLLYKAAVKYLGKAGIEENTEDEEFLVVAFAIVLEWYEQGSQGAVSIGARQMINQLKLDAVAAQQDPRL